MNHDITGRSTIASNKTIANTATKVLIANGGRMYAVLCNDSNEDMYVAYNTSTGLAVNKGIRLNKNGGTIEIAGQEVFKGEVWVICASGNKNMSYLEVT